MRLGLKKRFPFVKIAVTLAFLVILTALFIFFIIRAEPIFKERAADASTQVVRACIDEVSSDVLKDLNLFGADSNSLGEVLVVDLNTAQMNEIRTAFSAKLSEKLSETHIAKIDITLGGLMGYPPLQGLGFQIPVKIYFGSISAVEIKDEFISAGINQTKYMASLDVSVTSAVISAFMSDSKEINVTLPICERILIGNVPNYYIPGKG